MPAAVLKDRRRTGNSNGLLSIDATGTARFGNLDDKIGPEENSSAAACAKFLYGGHAGGKLGLSWGFFSLAMVGKVA